MSAAAYGWGHGQREPSGQPEQGLSVRRYTFVVQVHPEGVSTLENLSTAELVRIAAMEEVGPQIERWLSEQASPRRAPRRPEAPIGPARE